ncbi:MAG: (Fe-S)-binding protein [Methylomonas sp.]|jgi:glycolate oxidase iron-sulfur subunit|uniref:(Fe-S)-binding protein n=1 Tax=Methylomonas sp. TaxID=418 RepID=UPI0025CC8E97|nr:(Fe-S)-binding protein [Methylomonas sp.]MCK9606544.1 (Fe-S)-binding protein [Methylomonas sp.]
MFDFMEMDFNAAGKTSQPIGSGPYIPDAAECMRCGMCVGSCPTFRLFQIDEETPRRRIRSISKLLVENQPLSDMEHQHLHNCLQCRACESVCPSRMAYGNLFDQAQAALQTPRNWLAKLAFRVIEQKRRRNRLMPLLGLYLKSGMRKPLRKTGWLKKLRLAEAEALLTPPALTPLKPAYPTAVNRRGSVALFTGCIAEQFDRDTLLASITLLNAIGFEVSVPPRQGCCGAIHQHNGQAAAGLIANNLQVFNALPVDAVIHTASGCGAMLSEYRAEDEQAVQLFSNRLADINEFLLQHWPEDLVLKPVDSSVAVHEPCSQRNLLKNQHAVYALLDKIPGLSVAPLPDNQICCGAGGSYMLSHPENAKALRSLKTQAISASAARMLVSSNFGCMCFLNADPALNEQKFVHPLQLLAASLP